MISLTLNEIKGVIGAELEGDPNVEIHGIATLQSAKPGDIAFLDNPQYRKYLSETKASAVILTANEKENCPVNALVMDNPYIGYARLTTMFVHAPSIPAGLHATVVVGENTTIADSACIAPRCVIGNGVTIGEKVRLHPGVVVGDNAVIGDDTILYPNVSIYHGVKLGKRCIVHANSVIGSDGFGLAKDNGIWHKIQQLGGVEIADDVEIGANTTIDRGAIDNTVIEQGVKIDNQVQVAHNVHIGAHSAIAGCVGIAGSAKIGKHCMLAGMVGVSGHVEVCDNVAVTGMTVVSKSVTKPGVYSSGMLMQPNKEWRKNAARFRHLDALARQVKRIDKQVNALIEERDEHDS